MSRRLGGMTLLEVLAAMVVLGVIVAAVTPILVRAGQSGAAIEERVAAEAVLQDALYGTWVATLPLGDGAREVPDHPGWQVSWASLVLQVNCGAAPIVMARRWVRFSVQGPTPGAIAVMVLPLPVPLSAALPVVTP